MRRFLVALVAALVGAVGMAAPASASQAGHPFKATFSGATTNITFAPGFDFATNPTATSTFDGRCPDGASWVIEQGGTGHGTYLGDFTWTSTHCTLLTSLNPPDATIYAGRLRFTTTKGAVLKETYRSVGGLSLQGDQLCSTTSATFTGGTGRFRHARGTATEAGCWPASIQGPVITGLVIHSTGTIYLGHHRHHHR